MPRVVVVGSINMDLVVRCRHMPRPGETVRGQDLHTIPGGKGANQAVAAARLGAETHFVGRVGEDDFGQRLRQGLADNEIHVEYLSVDHERPTGLALIMVQESGENSIVVAGGANNALTPKDVMVARSVIEAADAVLLQLEIPIATIMAAIEAAHRANARVILDAGPATDIPVSVRNAPDVLSPNLVEAEALLGHPVPDALSAARELVACGARACVVKSGSDGCAWASAEGSEQIPAVPVQAVDTTAAGDAFTAALGVALAEGQTLAAAARWATYAGALAVTKFGAQPSMPTRRELEHFITAKG
jgi:ribokinase